MRRAIQSTLTPSWPRSWAWPWLPPHLYWTLFPLVRALPLASSWKLQRWAWLASTPGQLHQGNVPRPCHHGSCPYQCLPPCSGLHVLQCQTQLLPPATLATQTHPQDRADQAVTNTDNCRRLLRVVDWVRGVLAEVPAESVRQGAEQEARELQAALQASCDFLQEFGPTTFWQRVKRATADQEDFTRHDVALRESVSVSC